MAKPIVLVVMDGIGIAPEGPGNAVRLAYTPTLDHLFATCPWTAIQAHGEAVGLPSDDDMGNSEVGHNALGSGQIYAQGAKLVNQSIESGAIWESDVWRELVAYVKAKDGALHLIGLLSDGNVHSHIDQLKALISRARDEAIERVRVHPLLDGRDVPATSALIYIDDLQDFMDALSGPGFDARFASGGGRMRITMDRYQADWGMVERGWQTHVLGEGRSFASAHEAITVLREENPGVIDQDLPPFVIADEAGPVGTIEDGDGVIFFNFRGDRAIEISQAFEGGVDFDRFDRVRVPDVYYAGMLQYDGDLQIPSNYLVAPPAIQNTLTEFLNARGVYEFACSETQKYGHVTYFWNGNRSGRENEELETYLEIPSDKVSFDERPWMKAAEIADAVIAAIEEKRYGFIRCNFANGDMVGHTGVLRSVRIAVEAVDLALSRILAAAAAHDCLVVVTADHGNADDMLQKVKGSTEMQPRTAHSLNPVPFIIADPDGAYRLREGRYGLANVAATVVTLLGHEPPAGWEPSMLEA